KLVLSDIEQFANVTLINLPTTVWSVVAISKLFTIFIFLILSLPLLYVFFILFFFFKNQITMFYLGYQTQFENKSINFTLFTKNLWRTLWSYAYDILPRQFSFDSEKLKNKN
ncbi:MAG: hypothetical protein KC550_07155, partial [Nanoarchaeota archaeon]|nr:hypothetical protein [Nanoarchaeota archaeon]